MSSLTTIRISHKHGFLSKECLEESLEVHNLQNSVDIEQLGRFFRLVTSTRTRAGNRSRAEEQLQSVLDNTINQILPTYTRLLAIKEFEAKKFVLKSEKSTSEGEVLIFEKSASLQEGGKFERLIVTIRHDNTLTVDAVNFTGRKCLDTTGSFEAKIGKVIKREMKPESSVSKQNKIEAQDRQRLRI